MWGRELRAGLVFVVASVLIGGAFRGWQRDHRVRFEEIVASLVESDQALRPAPGRAAAPDGATAATGDAAGEGDATPGSGQASGGAGVRRPAAPPLRPASIDVDRATAEELLRLPGIGPALAARIVADREAHGPFGGPEGILRVSGIGPKTLAKLRGYLSPSRAADPESLPRERTPAP